MAFPSTRAQALARLDWFLPRAGRAYAANRNRDEGPETRNHVSGLSPAIRRRLVTEQEVASAAVRAHGSTAAAKFVEEVCWRSYWRGWLELRPAVWSRMLQGVRNQETRLGRDAALARDYADAIAGRTGIDAFDFWARELVETGYLHNHARMSFASIWIFTLKLPWELGAAHFFRHLLDACPASNTLSWRWVAGLQTAGKAYLARADIIRRTSGGRFRVEGPLAPTAEPVADGPVPPPGRLRTLPAPDPERPTGLLVHSEDLLPETVDFGVRVRAIAAVDGIGGDPAPAKRAFANAALADGVTRARRHFDVEADRLPEAEPEALRAFAARHRLTQIVTAFAPVGPVATRLELWRGLLAADGVALAEVMRPWDALAFPRAARGYFQFRGAIPALLAL